jgi:hypothetical protein
MLRCVALVRTDVSEEPGASFIRVTRIGELGITQAATSNRRTLWRNTNGVTSQKTPFFLVTGVKTSNPTTPSLFVSCVEAHSNVVLLESLQIMAKNVKWAAVKSNKLHFTRYDKV